MPPFKLQSCLYCSFLPVVRVLYGHHQKRYNWLAPLRKPKRCVSLGLTMRNKVPNSTDGSPGGVGECQIC
jgi:hypothetical protein